MKTATLCKTNRGFGYKVVFEGQWLYTSEQELCKLITGDSRACKFREIKESQDSSQKDKEEIENDVE